MTQQQLSAGLSGKLEQHTSLSLNQRRSLEMLALPVVDLDLRLQSELQSNPMLEIEENLAAELPAANAELAVDSGNYDENDYENNGVLAESWADDLPLPGTGDANDDRRDFFSQISAPPPALKSSLLAELAVLSLPENIARAALEIVGALDDDGYLSTSTADLAMVAGVDMPEMESALKIVQQIAPAGVAARDLPECLNLQLERLGKSTAQLKQLLSIGIADLENNRLDHLADKLHVSLAEVESMLKTLRSLNPAPGRQEGGAGVITPDLVIEKDGNSGYRVVPVYSCNMRIKVSPVYEKLLDDPLLADAERQFVSEKLASAREVVNSLKRRESTLVRLGELLIKYQRGFLDDGVEHLKSFTMKNAAAELDVSESTVSRAVDNKFVDTPQGVFPLKYFFAAGYSTADGDDVSGQAVKAMIRQLINDEDPARPMSDDAIARELKSRGVPVARRTVAKYREAINIPSSSLRKKFF